MDDKNKKTETKTEPEPKPEPEPKATMSQDVKDAIALSAATVAEALANHRPQVVMRGPPDHGPRCQVCRQFLKACGNKHRKAVVYPADPHYARWFDGVCINGIWYKSDHGADAIDVPESCEVENITQTWLRNEIETARGREKQHYSGALGGQNTTFNPATGWR